MIRRPVFVWFVVVTLLACAMAQAQTPTSEPPPVSPGSDNAEPSVSTTRIGVGVGLHDFLASPFVGPFENAGLGLILGAEHQMHPRLWLTSSLRAAIGDVSVGVGDGWDHSSAMAHVRGGARFVLNPGDLVELSATTDVGVTLRGSGQLGTRRMSTAVDADLLAGLAADLHLTDHLGVRLSASGARARMSLTGHTDQEETHYTVGATGELTFEPSVSMWWQF